MDLVHGIIRHIKCSIHSFRRAHAAVIISMISQLFASKLTTVNLAIFAAPVPLVPVSAFQNATTCHNALLELVGTIALILLVLIVLHVHLDITLITHTCLPQILLAVETNATAISALRL